MTALIPTRDMFTALYGDSDYRHTKSKCEKSAAENMPISIQLMTRVDKYCGGTLGTRALQKVVYGITHFSCGNTKLRVSLGRKVHSSYALKLFAPVGSGKFLAHSFIEECMQKLEDNIAGLDKEI